MKHLIFTRAARGIAAMVLLMAAIMKLIGDPGAVEIFIRLDMEPAGRFVVAFVELLAAMLLISHYAALGSLLAVSIMLGAIIAHITQLGIVVNDDGGLLFGMLFIVLLCASFVLVSRRREIPLIGDTL